MRSLYYELAFHDILQATCPKVTCVHSNKAVEVYPDNKVYVNETWGLRCLGKSYPQILLNNATQDPGFFEAFVPVAKVPGIPAGLLKDLVFPNMVVDFKAGSAGWTVEFQCLALWGKAMPPPSTKHAQICPLPWSNQNKSPRVLRSANLMFALSR